jgi:3-oxoacyl-[acyl-carrier protein] reductase
MSYLLENKVSLITGSTRGLGLGIAECLADGGSKIALNYHGNREVAEQAREKLQAKGAHVMLIRADVTDKFQVSSMVEAVEEKWGSVDILVPNATGPQPQKPIEEYDADFYREMYEFFVLSPFLLTQSALPGMKKRKWGRIINITSEVYHASVPQFVTSMILRKTRMPIYIPFLWVDGELRKMLDQRSAFLPLTKPDS